MAEAGFRLTHGQRQRVADFREHHDTSVLTLVFTDMVGSTGLKAELGDVAGTALVEAQHQVVRKVLAGFPGFAEREPRENAGTFSTSMICGCFEMQRCTDAVWKRLTTADFS